MNKAYIIVPGLLLIAFLAVQRPAQRRIEAAAQAHAAHVLQTRAADEARRQAAQDQAAAAARLRATENENQERLKAETKRQAYEKLLRHIDDETATLLATNDRLAQELATLDRQFVDLHAQHVATDRAVFDLSKKVELQRTERRSADLELQRTVTILAQRVADSAWTQGPTRALTPTQNLPR